MRPKFDAIVSPFLTQSSFPDSFYQEPVHKINHDYWKLSARSNNFHAKDLDFCNFM